MNTMPGKLSESAEHEMWVEAIFVFDTSSLLNFYEYSQKTRQDIYTSIFPLLPGRLWITSQIQFEFFKHKEKVLSRPGELYQEIQEKHFPSRHFKEFQKQYEQLRTRTAKDSRHPHLDQQLFKDFDVSVRSIISTIDELEKRLNDSIDKQIAQHTEEMKNDTLLDFFQVSPGYTFAQQIEIVKEGEFRYRNTIPPGYADSKRKEELGFGKYGDLIIWKQMLDLARERKTPVIFVTDDLKEDWFQLDKKGKGNVIAPRFELAKEMVDEAGVTFYAYSTPDFLYKAQVILHSPVEPHVLSEVQQVASRHNQVEEAVFQWAGNKFKADATYWASEYSQGNSGADIIQTLDGVLFSIQIKHLTGRWKMKELLNVIEDIGFIEEDKIPYEAKSVVVVSEDAERAGAFKSLLQHDSLREFQFYAGYIDGNGSFVEVK